MPATKTKSTARIATPVNEGRKGKSYNSFKEYGDAIYTGMAVGRSHKWNYDKSIWRELKFKLAHKRASKTTWSVSDNAERKALIKLLKNFISKLEAEPELATPVPLVTTNYRPQSQPYIP